MKKLMIAAAAAAMVGGVYADSCVGCHGGLIVDTDPEWQLEEPEVYVPGHIWDITIKAKTLVRKSMKCTDGCADCDDANKVCYFDNGNRTFNGVAWTCYEPCRNVTDINFDEYDGDDEQEQFNVVMWETKSKTGFGHAEVAQWWANAVNAKGETIGKITGYDVAPCADITLGLFFPYDALRYGKKADKVAWSLSYDGSNESCLDKNGDTFFDWKPQQLVFNAVALGNVKTYKVKGAEDYLVIEKATGSAVGWVTDCDCETQALAIPVCYENFVDWCEDGYTLDEVPFYGTLTIKYNKAKSQKLRTTAGYLAKPGNVFPSYALSVLDPYQAADILVK